MENFSVLHVLIGTSIVLHGFTVVQLYDIRNSYLFKLSIFFNFLLGASAIWMFLEDDFNKIQTFLEHFDVILTGEMSHLLAYSLFFIILITTIIALISLMIGPGKLFNNPGEKSKL